MAIPTIISVTPPVGHTGGKSVVEIQGTGFQTWTIPAPNGRPTAPAWPTVQVLFGTAPGAEVAVVSPERLFVRTPPSPLPIAKPYYGEGVVDLVVKNLSPAGIPINTEVATLTNGYRFLRPPLTAASDLNRVMRQLIREFRLQVLANSSSGAHGDFDENPEDLLNVVDVARLPAFVLFGPTLTENKFFRIHGRVYGQQEGHEADAYRAPETDDLVFTFVGISNAKTEAIALQSAVRQFFKNNPWLFLDRDEANPDQGRVAYDLVLDASGMGFLAPPDSKSSLRAFSGSFVIRGFDHESIAGFPLGDRVERVHDVIDTEEPPPPPPPTPSSAKEIVTFDFPDGVGIIGDGAIEVSVPFGTDVSALTPAIAHTGVSISPQSGEPQNFTTPVTYTVTAEDGSTRTYVVTVIVASAELPAIQAFGFPEGAGSINGTSIEVIVPLGTDRSALIPTITFTGVSVSPPSGAVNDFSGNTPWQWDDTAKEAYKTYSFGGQNYISYVGTVDAAAERFSLITEFSLAGIAFWVLGREDGRIYDRLRAYFGPSGSDVSCEVSGWYNDGWNDESHAAYMGNWDVFSEVNPYWYDLGLQSDFTLTDGTISERAVYDAQMVADAHARGDLVIPAIADHLSGQIDTIVSNPTTRTALVTNIVNTVVARQYDGIDLNFESGTSSARTAFTTFVTQLATALHVVNKRLVLTLKPAANSTREGQLIFDYAALAGSGADRFKIMAYDNFDPAVPGPFAPISWIRDVLSYAINTRGIPGSKIQLAIHNYAWTWVDNLGTWELQTPFDTYQAVAQRSGAVQYTVTASDSSTKTYDVSVAYPVVVGSGEMSLGTNFWYHTALSNNWSGEASMIAGINWASAYGPGTAGLADVNIWNPAWLAELAPYRCLRFMDWGNTNHSQLTSWSQRMLPTDPNNEEVYIDGSSTPPNPGIAYEWMIDLCNRTAKDLWVCIPAMADADFWEQLATLIRDKLAPNRRVYVEYSNETWNGSFSQFTYVNNQGVSANTPGMNQWYKGQSFCVWQSLRIFQTFEDVFGGAAMGTRVIRVMCMGGDMQTVREALTTVYQDSGYNPTNQVIDMLAFAPYIGSSLDGSSPTIQTDFHAAIDALEADELAFAVATKTEFNIALLGAYEGGQHLLANSRAWTENPTVYDEYRYMLSRWSQHFDLFCHYTHTGRWTNAAGQSSWGALDHTGQSPAEAHKYRALVDFAAGNP